ncbi:hypothetical protein ACIPSE_22915 [Streptomyces sp. NPDC090106]|uniref:hypothetical protein n=1 Tax=Streptomyces sp. NPDC090106 TaxID=3365946 RepID=UPI00381E32FE
MRGVRVRATTALLIAVAAGCGTGDGDVVVGGTAPATPYDGLLHLPVKEVDVDDEDGRAGLLDSGAAARALECEAEIYTAGGSDPWSEGDGGATPEDGLRAYFAMEQPEVPERGYRVEREEAGRVLYSYDVGGRTKVAVIVAKDREDRPGWGPETSASCDPAELPASWTDSKGYEVWTDRDGDRVPVAVVSSAVGAAHCDWQSAHFLGLGEGRDARTYARDPQGVLGPETLTGRYDGDATLPAGARDSGYRLDDWRLWLTDDPARVYVRTPDGVEAWPRVRQGGLCK